MNVASRSKSSPKAGATGKPASRLIDQRPVKLLAGGNPQIAKADGDAPLVPRHIAATGPAQAAALPGWIPGRPF